MTKLKEKAEHLYTQYFNDRFCIPQSRSHLFNRPATETIILGHDALHCWIASVEEALLTQEQRAELERIQLKKSLCRFLCSRKPKAQDPIQSNLYHPIFSSTHSFRRKTNNVPARKATSTSSRCSLYKHKALERTVKNTSNRTLQNCGFTMRCVRSDKANAKDPKWHTDSSMKILDFSSIYVSTTP